LGGYAIPARHASPPPHNIENYLARERKGALKPFAQSLRSTTIIFPEFTAYSMNDNWRVF
jgi:hypothetical protein